MNSLGASVDYDEDPLFLMAAHKVDRTYSNLKLLQQEIWTIASCTVPDWATLLFSRPSGGASPAVSSSNSSVKHHSYFQLAAVLCDEPEAAEWLSKMWPGRVWWEALKKTPSRLDMRVWSSAPIVGRSASSKPSREIVRDACVQLRAQLFSGVFSNIASRLQMFRVLEHFYVERSAPMPLPNDRALGSNLLLCFCERVRTCQHLSEADVQIVASIYSALFDAPREEDAPEMPHNWFNATRLVHRMITHTVERIQALRQEMHGLLPDLAFEGVLRATASMHEQICKQVDTKQPGAMVQGGLLGESILEFAAKFDSLLLDAVERYMLRPMRHMLEEHDTLSGDTPPPYGGRYTAKDLFKPQVPEGEEDLEALFLGMPRRMSRMGPKRKVMQDRPDEQVSTVVFEEAFGRFMAFLASPERREDVEGLFRERNRRALPLRFSKPPEALHDYRFVFIERENIVEDLSKRRGYCKKARVVGFVVLHRKMGAWSLHLFYPGSRVVPTPMATPRYRNTRLEKRLDYSEIYAPRLQGYAPHMLSFLTQPSKERLRTQVLETHRIICDKARPGFWSEEFQKPKVIDDALGCGSSDTFALEASLVLQFAAMTAAGMWRVARKAGFLRSLMPEIEVYMRERFSRYIFVDDELSEDVSSDDRDLGEDAPPSLYNRELRDGTLSHMERSLRSSGSSARELAKYLDSDTSESFGSSEEEEKEEEEEQKKRGQEKEKREKKGKKEQTKTKSATEKKRSRSNSCHDELVSSGKLPPLIKTPT